MHVEAAKLDGRIRVRSCGAASSGGIRMSGRGR